MSKNKIRKIVVVDDREENRAAAVAGVKKVLPSARVRVYSSAREFISSLGDNPASEIDLVLSDMNIEDRRAGYRVAVAAWSWNIPTFIVSGGQKDHGQDTVVVGGLSFEDGYFFGEKNDRLIWSKTLRAVLKSFSLRMAMVIGKKGGRDVKYGKARAKLSVQGILHDVKLPY